MKLAPIGELLQSNPVSIAASLDSQKNDDLIREKMYGIRWV